MAVPVHHALAACNPEESTEGRGARIPQQGGAGTTFGQEGALRVGLGVVGGDHSLVFLESFPAATSILVVAVRRGRREVLVAARRWPSSKCAVPGRARQAERAYSS